MPQANNWQEEMGMDLRLSGKRALASSPISGKVRSKRSKKILIDRESLAAKWNGHVPVLLEIALPAQTSDPEPMFNDMTTGRRRSPTSRSAHIIRNRCGG